VFVAKDKAAKSEQGDTEEVREEEAQVAGEELNKTKSSDKDALDNTGGDKSGKVSFLKGGEDLEELKQ